jgi:hypothetical protein
MLLAVQHMRETHTHHEEDKECKKSRPQIFQIFGVFREEREREIFCLLLISREMIVNKEEEEEVVPDDSYDSNVGMARLQVDCSSDGDFNRKLRMAGKKRALSAQLSQSSYSIHAYTHFKVWSFGVSPYMYTYTPTT